MERIFLFSATNQIDKTLFLELMSSITPNLEIEFDNDYSGHFKGDASLALLINEKAYEIQNKMGCRMAFLAVHKLDHLATRSLSDSLAYFPGICTYLSDVLFKQFSHGNFSSLHYLKQQFIDVDSDVMETAGAYLRYGMEGLEAARSMNIHRNTFNYRLKEFIRVTDLDIRDYHNALLLEIYFQYCYQ